MKKFYLIFLITTGIFLAACTNDNITTENNVADSSLDGKPNNTRDNITGRDTKKDFNGISSSVTTPEIGNSSSNLINRGYICDYKETIFYRNINGDDYLYKKDTEGEKNLLLKQRVYSINILDNYIYFINEDLNNAICKVDIDGENLTVLNEDTFYFLLVSEDYIYYTDEENKLYQSSLDGKDSKLLSDEGCAWPNLYRDYIIFSSFEDTSKLMAVNISSGESILIAEYGFFPTVYEDKIYYQIKNGNINVMDLMTGDNLYKINKWGQQFHPTEDGIFFTNSSSVFYYNKGSKKTKNIPLAFSDEDKRTSSNAVVNLVHRDENIIYYTLSTNDLLSLVCLNTETGDAYNP